MKNFIYTILLLLSFNGYAQPGDILGMEIRRVDAINALLKVDPENRTLIWKRLSILYKPRIDLYSKSQKGDPEPNTIMISGNESIKHHSFEDVNILKDINYLLSDTASIQINGGYLKAITHSNFYYKRGQYYYLNGKPKQALSDYLIALDLNPDYYLKNALCISIAAYYYNLDTTFNLLNLEKSLAYIDIAIPKEIENTPETFERFTDRKHHPFEQEKIMLLEVTGNDKRLENYLKILAKSQLNLYNNQIKGSEDYKKSHSYTIPRTLETGLGYLYQIAENYYNDGEFEKSKNIMETMIGYIPEYNTHQMAYHKYYLLFENILKKDCCKETTLEITNILNIAGYPNLPLRGRIIKPIINQIDKHIIKQPKIPQLYLAKAIFIYKEDKLHPKSTIITLVDTAQNLGLVDYRIPYLRGLVFRYQMKYVEALQEFDKAIAIFENDPFPYRAKLEILQQIPNYDETEIKAIRDTLKSLPLAVSSNITELIMLIDEL